MSSKPNGSQSFLYFISILFIIAAPGIYFRLLNDTFLTLVLNTLSVFSLFLLPTVFIRRKLKWYAWFLLPVILVGIVNFACIYHYKSPLMMA